MLKAFVVRLDSRFPVGGRVHEVQEAVIAQLPQRDFQFFRGLKTLDALTAKGGEISFQPVAVPGAGQTGPQQHQPQKDGRRGDLEQDSAIHDLVKVEWFGTRSSSYCSSYKLPPTTT